MADWSNPYPINPGPQQDTVRIGFEKLINTINDIYDKLNTTKKLQASSIPPSSPSMGEFWFDLGSGTLKRYDGSSWVIVVGGENNTSVPTTPPDNPAVGELYYDLITKTLKVFNGSEWVDVVISSTSGDQPKQDARTGDLWYDLNTKTLKVFDGTNWVDVSISTYFGNTAPTQYLKAGDLWYDTTNHQLKIYDGTQWLSAYTPPEPDPTPTPSSSSIVFKNYIINGDFKVFEREITNLFGDGAAQGGYFIDRWYCEMTGGQMFNEVKQIYGDNEGATANTLDVFGDGSCIACYTFDGNANDLSGNYNGTWSGNEQYTVGRFNQCAKFDGNSFIDLPSVTNLALNLQKHISFWFYANDVANHQLLLQIQQNDAGWANLDIFIENYQLKIGGRSGHHSNTSYTTIWTTNIYKNIWYHLVLDKKDNGTYNVYLNTKPVGSFLFDFYEENNPYRIVFGVFKNAPDNSENMFFFNGAIEQCRIFNRALTEDEIKRLYVEDSQYIDNPIAVSTILSLPSSSEVPIKYVPFCQKFEGQHLYHLVKQGKDITISFDFRASVAGDYTVALINKTDPMMPESYLAKFNYDTPGILARKSVVIPLSAFQGLVRNDNNLGFELVIAGEGLVGQEGYTNGQELIQAIGTVNLDVYNYVSIKDVQLEEGSTATEFERIPIDYQILRCRRYYRKSDDGTYSYNDQVIPMRTTPTVVGNSPYYFDAELY